MAAVKRERALIGVNQLFAAPPPCASLYGYRRQYKRQFAHVGTPLDAAKTLFDAVAKTARQIHADKICVLGFYLRARGPVRSGTVRCLRFDNGVVIVEREAQQHVVYGYTSRMYAPALHVKVVPFGVDKFGLEIDKIVIAGICTNAYAALVQWLAIIG